MGAAAVIVAAGRGTRAGGAVPKQWQMLAGRAVLAWTLEAFRTSPDIGDIVLVLHPGDMGLAPGYANHPDVDVVPGGETRAASVRAGLEALDGTGATRVLIHDAARPLVSHALIARVVAALDHSVGAAPALEVTDSLWRGDGGIVSGTLSRAGLWRAQTPQGFRFDAILAAHRSHAGHPGGDAATDDVAVARAAGLDVAIVPGDERNLKITGPDDFARAERLMGDGMDIRVGNGFDVHRFTEGDAVVLCGVRVPHARGLDGHSDADVGMHALTDAIYGALADGDIGRHFPPSDAQWKGADSAIFLEHAMSRARARGFELANADVTLVCERPKIAPHAEAMRLRLAEILEVDPGRVSVKATTSERLGFTGREEGIAAQATATLIAR
jgi:2-C-methyl-D-erythritol 4-phosphate cytidylyltransferase/2-C-methyl-D-erythritol 2,4-cyclodiphosphate synthase